MSAQQEAVYAAEGTCERGRTFADHGEVQAYVDGLTSTYWWEERYNHIVRVEVLRVTEGRSRANASHDMGGGTIGLLDGSLDESTVLHEVAHVIAGNECGHSSTWARIHLELTYLVRGSGPYSALSAAYTTNGVDVG